MNFKSIGLSAAIATAAIAGSSFATSPVQASTLTGNLSFTGSVMFDSVAAPTQLKFLSFNVSQDVSPDGSQGSTDLAFDTPHAKQVTVAGKITPATIKLDSSGNAGHYTGWLTGLQVSGKTLSFDLDSFSLGTATPIPERINGKLTGSNFYIYAPTLLGKFSTDGKETVGSGVFTTQFKVRAKKDVKNPRAVYVYSGFLTAVPVPTPALLPGLLALGAGIVRKRKAEESSVEMGN